MLQVELKNDDDMSILCGLIMQSICGPCVLRGKSLEECTGFSIVLKPDVSGAQCLT